MIAITAVIVAGGVGIRMRPYIGAKCLATVGQKPILAHIIERLEPQVEAITVCTGYEADIVENYLHTNFPKVEISRGDVGDSISRRLHRATEEKTGPALLCYGDTIANIDLQQPWKLFQNTICDGVITVCPIRSEFGVVDLTDDGKILRFREKPLLPHYANIGYMILGTEALSILDPEQPFEGYLTELTDCFDIYAYKYQGKHWTINTEKDRLAVEKEIDLV